MCLTKHYIENQLGYAEMLNKVDPLRQELRTLEERAQTTRIKGDEIQKIVHDLEKSINQYKEEYAVLISEANAIKSDLATVEAKVSINIHRPVYGWETMGDEGHLNIHVHCTVRVPVHFK